MLVKTGEWNTKVGKKAESNVIEKFGRGVKNKAGDWLVDFCETDNLSIENTCFQQPSR